MAAMASSGIDAKLLSAPSGTIHNTLGISIEVATMDVGTLLAHCENQWQDQSVFEVMNGPSFLQTRFFANVTSRCDPLRAERITPEDGKEAADFIDY